MIFDKFNNGKILENGTLVSRLPFVFFVVFGGGILLLMKIIHVNQSIVSTTSVFLILSYALIVYFIPTLRLREDYIGDNCYYIGFIYTLCSLIWALEAFSRSTDVNEIIANFGLALISTVAGIILRVVMGQIRKDVIETDREYRIELSNAASRMRSKIDESVLTLDSFCRTTKQMTEECIRDNTNKSSEAMSSCINKLNTTSEQILQKINEAAQAFEKISFQVNSSTQSVERAIAETANKINAISIPKELVTKQLEQATVNIGSTLESLVIQIKKHNDAISEEVNRSQSMTHKLANTLSDLTDSITDKIQ